MFVIAAAVPLAFWMLPMFGLAVVLLIALREFVGLPTKRLEAKVISKEYHEPTFDPYAAASQSDLETNHSSDWFIPERHMVRVQANRETFHVQVEPELFKLITDGADVYLNCVQGRITGRITPISLELPMPAAPTDPVQIM